MKEKNISRRSFLKKMGAGAIGLGAISLTPATANLKLTKNGIFDANSVNTSEINIGNTDGVGIPSSSSDPGISFDTWRQPDSDNPVLISVSSRVETDGSTPARTSLQVDESGGTSLDYKLRIAWASKGLGGGNKVHDSVSAIIPAGAQYRISNDADPNNNNAIKDHREFSLG